MKELWSETSTVSSRVGLYGLGGKHTSARASEGKRCGLGSSLERALDGPVTEQHGRDMARELGLRWRGVLRPLRARDAASRVSANREQVRLIFRVVLELQRLDVLGEPRAHHLGDCCTARAVEL